mmetsp:Transcript_31112/g.63196  ORF Transcript_31112/g.63196 Transcript_31112/m.63196 type:complete len:215 (+) Transcript_31112:835-1479(+)
MGPPAPASLASSRTRSLSMTAENLVFHSSTSFSSSTMRSRWRWREAAADSRLRWRRCSRRQAAASSFVIGTSGSYLFCGFLVAVPLLVDLAEAAGAAVVVVFVFLAILAVLRAEESSSGSEPVRTFRFFGGPAAVATKTPGDGSGPLCRMSILLRLAWAEASEFMLRGLRALATAAVMAVVRSGVAKIQGEDLSNVLSGGRREERRGRSAPTNR